MYYTFVTRRILDHVKACGYDKYNDVIPSDHRGFFLDLSVPGLFGRDIPTICTPSQRCIRGDQPSNITKYIKFLGKYIEDHNLERKALELLKQPGFTHKAVNVLDDIITAAILAAQQKCSTNYRILWCEETHEIMNAIYILQIHLSALRNNKNFDEVIQSKMEKLKSEISLPEDVATTKKELRK